MPSQNTKFNTWHQSKALDILPADLWQKTRIVEGAPPICPYSKTLKDCLLKENIQHSERQGDTRKITIKSDGMMIIIMPMAKADFNHDGWEDLLINYTQYSRPGSYRSYTNICLEWTNNQDVASIIPCLKK